jgi:Na+-driven multidrug efflux pump
MANSGIMWIDVTFDWCVRLLYEVAGWIGVTYEEINVWLFVIILPIFLLISGILNLVFFIKLQNLKSSI